MGTKGKKIHRDDRRAILRAILGGASYRRTAHRFGVSRSTVERVAPPVVVERLRRWLGRFRPMVVKKIGNGS